MLNEIKCPNCGEIFQIDETSYARIVEQVRTDEFNHDLDERADALKKHYESELQKAALVAKQAQVQAVDNQRKETEKKEREVIQLKEILKNAEESKKLAVSEAVRDKESKIADKDKEILNLRGQLKEAETGKELALSEAKRNSQEEIAVLKQKLVDNENSYKAEIERIKDYKAKLSTKMIGEDLEQHCLNAFNSVRAMTFPKVQFYKDNDSKDGSKGDFIYRELDDDGTPILSIMFEMKNECDTTATKHKNEHFFDKLDKDRKKKDCEYAVLVSMLEQDNDFYNAGIVDVSYEHPKMYVVRPQCFLTIIHLLRTAALESLAAKKELSEYKKKESDFTNFEQNLLGFQNAFTYNVDQAKKRHQEAIDEIDNAIKALGEVKKRLEASNKHLDTAEKKVSDMTIKKLTKGAPGVYDKIIEARVISIEEA